MMAWAIPQRVGRPDEKLALMSGAVPMRPSREAIAALLASSSATVAASQGRLRTLYPHVSSKVVLRLTEQGE